MKSVLEGMFLSSAEHKRYYEEYGYPNSCWSSLTSIVWKKYHGSQWFWFGYLHSSKYLLLCSAEERNLGSE